jgi:predicted permease
MITIIQNMLPVLMAGGGGWLLGRSQKPDLRTLGTVVVYTIVPLVNFDAVLKAPAEASIIVLPIMAFIIGSCNSWLAYYCSRRILQSDEQVLLTASSASSANTLYYGLGLALALLPSAVIPAFLLAATGFSLSEAIFGYYFLARTNFTWRMAVGRVLRLPMPYAVLIGILCRNLISTTELQIIITPLISYSRGALILLGSMILGIAIAQEQRFQIAPRLVTAVLFCRHITFALVTLLFLSLDAICFHLINPSYYPLFMLFAAMPIANNTLTFAALLGLPTALISSTIIISNCVALLLAACIYSFYGING